MKFFAVSVFGRGKKERRVKIKIEKIIYLKNKESEFGYIDFPIKKVVIYKNGKKEIKEKRLLPGYLIIEMNPTLENFDLIRNIDGIGNFLGAEQIPTPLLESEVNRMIEKSHDIIQEASFQKEDYVRIIAGPFVGFKGDVKSSKGNKVKVAINVLKREVIVDINASQIKHMK